MALGLGFGDYRGQGLSPVSVACFARVRGVGFGCHELAGALFGDMCSPACWIEVPVFSKVHLRTRIFKDEAQSSSPTSKPIP